MSIKDHFEYVVGHPDAICEGGSLTIEKATGNTLECFGSYGPVRELAGVMKYALCLDGKYIPFEAHKLSDRSRMPDMRYFTLTILELPKSVTVGHSKHRDMGEVMSGNRVLKFPLDQEKRTRIGKLVAELLIVKWCQFYRHSNLMRKASWKVIDGDETFFVQDFPRLAEDFPEANSF